MTSTDVSCASNDPARQLEHNRSVVQLLAKLVLEHRAQLPPCGHRLAIELERQMMPDAPRIGRSIRAITLLAPRHHLLDRTQPLPASAVEPNALVRGVRNPGQLAHHALAPSKRPFDLRQLAKLARDAQALGGGPWCVGKDLFQVFQPVHVAELSPDVLLLRAPQPRQLLGIQRCMLLRKPTQRAIDLASSFATFMERITRSSGLITPLALTLDGLFAKHARPIARDFSDATVRAARAKFRISRRESAREKIGAQRKRECVSHAINMQRTTVVIDDEIWSSSEIAHRLHQALLSEATLARGFRERRF